MDSKKIDQKEYLKKYLSAGDGSVKKKKKKPKIGPKMVKVIDDDIDLKNMRSLQEGEFDILNNTEDAPLIVGIVDESGPVDFGDKKRWKIIADDGDGDITVRKSDGDRRDVNDERFLESEISSNPKTLRVNNKKHDNDNSVFKKSKKDKGGRKELENINSSSDADGTKVNGKKIEKRHKEHKKKPKNNESDSDSSPPRRNKKRNHRLSNSPLKERRRNSDSDLSPPRKTEKASDSDLTPPRKSKKGSDYDLSPPRKSKKGSDSDLSPPRKSKRDSDSDLSPPRKGKGISEDNSRTLEKVRKDYKSDYSSSRKTKMELANSELTRARKSRKSYDSDLSPPRRSRLDPNIDISLPRKSRKNYDSDLSPPRRNKNAFDENSKPQTKSKKMSDSDRSRKNKRDSDPDLSPPRKSKNNFDSDLTPPRKSKTHSEIDLSPPRKSRKNYDSDLSPPRKSKRGPEVNRSPPRRDRKKDDSNSNPSRRNRRGFEVNLSPPNRNESRSESRHSYRENRNFSPSRRKGVSENFDSDSSSFKTFRRGSSPIRKGRDPDTRREDRYKRDSMERNTRESFRNQSPPISERSKSPHRRNKSQNGEKSRTDSGNDQRMKKTLDGKTAGLQDAKALREETVAYKKREAELFQKMNTEITGVGQAPVVRDRKTGRRRDFEAEAQEEREKAEKQKELDEKYARWGKGLKQAETQEERLKNDLYEMSKPLARYADDADLDRIQREQEREDDPMLDYIRKKQVKEGKRKPDRPQYEGSFMPNRFGIKPGHRWDGVDRSNGYERKWFAARNAAKARQEEAYKWSTADM